jgi:site-specific recombinase XerD
VCEIKFEYSKFKEQRKNIIVVSPKSCESIFNYYQKNMKNKCNFRNYLFLKILLDTGLRLSEIANIRIDNIDLDVGLILVTVTKTDVDRYVFLTESVRKLLYTFIITQNLENYLFTDFKEDKPLSTSSIECFIYRLRRKLGFKNSISPHKWRHTFATSYNKKGGNLETLRLLLGHSNIKTTQRYLHLDKDDILKEYKKIMG